MRFFILFIIKTNKNNSHLINVFVNKMQI